MPTPPTFLPLLPTIDALSAALARRRGLVDAEAEDFVAHVRAQFVATDYAALRQFRGDASIEGYLAVVIASWLRAYLFARDGRWRPSAAALRLGPVAVQLERLVTRGRRSADEAIAELLTGGDHPYSERELRAMLRQLPLRQPLRPEFVPDTLAANHSANGSTAADARVDAAEHDLIAARARQSLETALATLTPDDHLLVTMRFLDGLSVADIARALGREQKPLYRKLERALTALKRHLQAAGITAEVVHDAVERTK